MKTIIGWIIFLLLVVMLPGGWAQQPAEGALAQAQQLNQLGERGRAVGASVRPKDALAQAEQLNQQLIELYQQGRYTEAIPLAEKALAIREKVLGLFGFFSKQHEKFFWRNEVYAGLRKIFCIARDKVIAAAFDR